MLRRMIVIVVLIGMLCTMLVEGEAFIDKKEFPLIEETMRTGDLDHVVLTIQRVAASGLALEDVRKLFGPALERDDIRIKAEAACALIRLGDRHAGALLFDYVADPKMSVNRRLRVIAMLASLDDDSIRGELTRRARTETNPTVRLAFVRAVLSRADATVAAEFISELGQLAMTGTTPVKYAALQMLAPYKEGMPYLIEAFKDNDHSIVQLASTYLMSLKDPNIAPVVRPYLTGADNTRACYAALVLAAQGEPGNLQVIAGKLASDAPAVRQAALVALLNMAGTGHQESFLAAIKRIAKTDPDESIRKSAEVYLEIYNRTERPAAVTNRSGSRSHPGQSKSVQR